MNTHTARMLRLALLLTIPILAYGQKYSIYTKELPNGLDVIVIENPVVPLVTIEIDVRNGSYTEPPEYNGLSHLYEHMFFKANESIPTQERYLERTRELGMSWNGTTSEERVNYFFTFGKDSLEAGMEFMRAAILTPLFLDEELVKERPVVTGEYDRAEANPYFHLFNEINKKLWYEHYNRKNVIGNREVILTADEKKMRTIQQRYYIPNNSSLLVAGDVKHEEIYKLAEKYFGAWKKGPDPFELYPIPAHPPLKQSETVFVEKPVNAVTVQLSLHGPSVTKYMKATFAADVLSYILGQRSSKFQKQLVESGLCNFAGVGYYTLDHTGPITVQAQMTPEKYAEAEKALFEELKKLTDPDYYTDEQLENAKKQLEIQEMYNQEKPSTFVHTVGFWWAVTGSTDYYMNYIENLRKITREDINAYIKKYIQNAPYVKGILLSPEVKAKLFPQ
ncbi:MAG: insulinase family protein [Ignavibacteriae bacterium]|nr:insulinase family protein [Ignavibacteriota bacterium]